MITITGTNNKILDINLTNRQVHTFVITWAERKQYLGGKGLGLKLLYERLKPGTDPLSPDNILCFMPGVLMGSGAPCTGRFAALTKSPLTGLIVTSSCGGPFGAALKTAGYDGLLISGASNQPVSIIIEHDQVKFVDALPLMGLDTVETQSALKMEKGDGALVIGPAGENKVLFANIATGHRFLGRGGMGAVMGSKGIKAIMSRGNACKIQPKQLKRFNRTKSKALSYINANVFTAVSYRKYGTSSTVNSANKAGILPVNNFQDGHHESAHAISGETMREKYRSKSSSCRQCAILCGHKGTLNGKSIQVPEYETVGLLGSNLGVFDPDQIAAWNEQCGKLGMDTISCGAAIAFTMEAGEKGLLDTNLRFGSADYITETIEQITYRTGIGADMADGVRKMSEKYGGKEFAIHVKGMELSAYDPRGSWGQGLAYAVANRGGCHLSAYIVSLESLTDYLKPVDAGAKAHFVKFLENLTCCINSLHTCQFTMFAYVLETPIVRLTPKLLLSQMMRRLPNQALKMIDFSLYRDLWSSTTGISISTKQFIQAGERIHVLERYMNTREGVSSADDTLPDRILNESRPCDTGKTTQQIPLKKMLKQYYRLRGYDSNGIPKPSLLKKMGITAQPKPIKRFLHHLLEKDQKP